MARRLFSGCLMAILAWSLVPGLQGLAGAQSLADVARAEEVRRKAVKQPAKVYTNDDLKRSGDDSAPPPPGPSATTPAASPAPGGGGPAAARPDQAAGADGTNKDEAYWKGRISAAREALAHDKVLVDALQSRVNALTTDFVNAADPAQRAVIDDNRKTALAEMDRLNKDVDKQTKAIAEVQEEARKASVPPGWLR